MIVARVQCICLKWVSVETAPDAENPKREYGWRIHTHNNGCGRKIELERKGGHGARIIGKCDGIVRQINVDYEE